MNALARMKRALLRSDTDPAIAAWANPYTPPLRSWRRVVEDFVLAFLALAAICVDVVLLLVILP